MAFTSATLHDAIRASDAETVRQILRSPSVDVNAHDELSLMDHDGRRTRDIGDTPLQLAVREGNLEIVKIIVADPRVDPNTMDFFGDSPLHTACEMRREKVVRLLLASYWDVIKLPDPETLRGRELRLGLACGWEGVIPSGKPILELFSRYEARDSTLRTELQAEFKSEDMSDS
jgi:hypothetical protein